MGKTIGIFEKEQQVMSAIELLRSAGAHPGDLRVIVKNEESVPLLSADGNVHVESIIGIKEGHDRAVHNRDAEVDGSGGWTGTVPPGPLTGILAVPQTNGIGGYSGAGVIPTAPLVDWDDDDKHTENVLVNLDLPSHATGRLAEDVESGRLLLVVEERSDDQSERLLSQAGALDIVN